MRRGRLRTKLGVAVGDEFEDEVFEVGGIASLFDVNDSLTVTRELDAEWGPVLATA